MLALEPSVAALDPARPIAPQVYRRLRESIIRNRLKPGARISETEIANELAISRQPVREAFIKLAEQGLLSVRPQRRTLVSRIGYHAVLDARFMREAVEADIVAILAHAPDPALMRELRGQIERQNETPLRDAEGYAQLDELFHRTMAEAAGKAGVWRRLEDLKSQMDRVRFLSLDWFPMAKLTRQHETLVDRIERGDAAAADAVIRHHTRELLRDLPQIRDAHPDFFETPEGALPEPAAAPIKGGNDA
jgi:DNA-binding GntR family transcriptional regulator